MTNTEPDTDTPKRAVTSDGHPLGWASRGDDGALYLHADPGLLRGCDSWIAPSWDDRARFRVDDDAVAGVGEATVVIGVRVAADDAEADRSTDGARAKNGPGRPR
ncbi:hypothetical protein ACFQRB_18030 [Halobaculum litoreum]|uniref:Uncharacterized protein n=1 Tax=Halobaculum litoreum TaxID=3031998 RepID=A0ABD5XVT9_9EURY